MVALTREEQKILVFLAAISLLGLSINFLIKHNAPLKAIFANSTTIGKLDLNTASRDSLINLPGIGPKSAERIIEYRAQHNGFKTLEELKDIKGVTTSRYQQLQEYLFVKE